MLLKVINLQMIITDSDKFEYWVVIVKAIVKDFLKLAFWYNFCLFQNEKRRNYAFYCFLFKDFNLIHLHYYLKLTYILKTFYITTIKHYQN